MLRIMTVALGVCFLLGNGEIRAQGKSNRPNIVFILADDLGINDLGCYGRKEHHTPNLDRLASQGMRFTCAYCAQPICSPTRAAIMTGKSPARLRLTTYLPGRANAPSQKLLHPDINQQLPLQEKTLAEYLRELGYATAMIGKWHLGGAGFGPERQGFDVVYMPKALTVPSDKEGGKGEYDLTLHAEKFIEANKDRPFFLYLAHNTPHIPLAAKAALIEKHKAAFNPTYAAMMETMDDCVGQLLRKLDSLGLADNTIVIFTSDNGGLHVLEFTGTPATHNGRFRAGKGFLYEGGLRIPLIVRWPGKVPAGKTEDTPVISMDWLPTFLELCGGSPARGPLDGVSIAPLLEGGKLAPRPLYWHFPHYTNQGSRPAGAIRVGDRILIQYYDDGKCEFYDLSHDIGETKNLATQNFQFKLGELQEWSGMAHQLEAWRQGIGVNELRPNPDFDSSLYKKLYVDVDVSRLRPASTAAQMEAQLKSWRQTMNAVLPAKKKQ